MNPETATQMALLIVGVIVGIPIMIVALRVIAGAAEAILGSAFIAVVVFVGFLVVVMAQSGAFFSGPG